MRNALLVTFLLLLLAGGYLAGRLLSRPHARAVANRATPHATQEAPPQRIISTAPSLTEILFALNAGGRVVGVTPYCQYPATARKLPKIGGLLDPNFEAIAALKPDLVVLLESASQHQPALESLGLNSLNVPQNKLDEVLESIVLVGAAVGKQDEANQLVSDIRARFARVERRVAGRGRPRVLMVVERDYAAGFESMTVAASNDSYDLFDRVIEIAGGRNAYARTAAPFPAVSLEGLLWIDPEVVVELVPPAGKRSLDKQSIRRQWDELPQLAAVKQHRVYVLDDDFAKIPGPRLVMLVEKLAGLLHPEEGTGQARTTNNP